MRFRPAAGRQKMLSWYARSYQLTNLGMSPVLPFRTFAGCGWRVAVPPVFCLGGRAVTPVRVGGGSFRMGGWQGTMRRLAARPGNSSLEFLANRQRREHLRRFPYSSMAQFDVEGAPSGG